MNLMEMIKGAVAQQAMDKLGGAIGLDSKKTSSAFDMASGALLGSLIKKASSGTEGARSVFDMARNADASVLDKIGDMFGGGQGSDAFQKAGGGILDGLLGGNKSGLIGTLAKALGLDSSVISKLLTMVGPLVVGMLGKQIKSQGLDAAGLAGFLGKQ